MKNTLYPLRDAARLKGVPEERLRRAILDGRIVAEPVPDDRQYLIRASELGLARRPVPSRAACALPALLALACMALALAAGAARSASYVCANCAAIRHTTELRLLDRQAVLRSRVQRDAVGALIAAEYPVDCLHEWMFVHAGGGRPLEGPAARRWMDLQRLNYSGLLESAFLVDSPGAAEFARWCLRHELPEGAAEEWLRRGGRFATAAQFRDWFARLRGFEVAR